MLSVNPYYSAVLTHLDQNELHNRPVLYLHARVYSPYSVQLHAMYRFTIYASGVSSFFCSGRELWIFVEANANNAVL